MKQLYLTGIAEVPNEAGFEKLENHFKPIGNKPNWESMGLTPPKGEAALNEEGKVFLEDDEVEEVFLDVVIPLKYFGGAVDCVDYGCMVYTTYGTFARVVETAEEVSNYAQMLSLNWLHRNYIYYKAKITNYFNKQQKQESNEQHLFTD